MAAAAARAASGPSGGAPSSAAARGRTATRTASQDVRQVKAQSAAVAEATSRPGRWSSAAGPEQAGQAEEQDQRLGDGDGSGEGSEVAHRRGVYRETPRPRRPRDDTCQVMQRRELKGETSQRGAGTPAPEVRTIPKTPH